MANRIAQVGVQILLQPIKDLRIVQVGTQVLLATELEQRISQLGVQALLDKGAYPTPPQRQYAQVI